jgi:hypothetical protein
MSLAERRPVLVLPAASEVRRQASTAAWTVLCELAACADDSGSVDANSSHLAAGVGLTKNTVARALQLLIARGLVCRRIGRDNDSGRFGPVGYIVDFDASGFARVPDQPTSTAPTRVRDSRPKPATACVGQLSLLDEASPR